MAKMSISKIIFGKIGKGTWRHRKQATWVGLILAGAFVVYAQLLQTSQVPRLGGEGEQVIQAHRFLYSLDQEGMKREMMVSDDTKQKVNFVSNHNNNDNNNDNGNPNYKDNDNYSDTNNDNNNNKSGAVKSAEMLKDDKFIVNDQSVQDRHKMAMQILQKRISERNAETEKSAVEPKLSDDLNSLHANDAPVYDVQHQDKVYAGNAAVAWSGGSFRYNPYGEPVYNHDNRLNYIPKERVVHLDLKGAPPLSSTYTTLIPWLAKYGATSILIEYEDMFPWEGVVSSFAAKNHYTKDEIKEILAISKANNIQVIPLVQTFGHLEFALKLPKYSYLREVPELPQALCPSQNDSIWLVKTMVDQIMALHPGGKYLHIGCDEVFQMGECDKCRMKSRENLFLDHVSNVAKYVRATHGVIPIIWHDMLTHVSDSAMNDYNFGELVEPMVWVYAEDVYRFVQPSMWTKFSQVFPNVWGASAFKGAFGEQSTVPNVRRHLDNNLNWLDVMASEAPKFSGGFRGLVLSGWQRHDHFAVLCELLPSALPSLAINLIATTHGFFNATVHSQLYEALNCMQTPKYQTRLNLDADPFLWDKFSWCYFPGALIFKSTARLDAARRDIRSYIDRVTLKRGWLSDYNRRHNFSSPMRIDEDLEELPSRLHTVTLLVKTAKEALLEWFDEWTTGEWIEQHIWPLLHELETLQKESESMRLVKTWPVRPLPILPQLGVYGINEPKPKAAEQPDATNSVQRSPLHETKQKIKKNHEK